jgi:6,7-dimethyl-8-ribityllumazine synthase
VTELSLVRDERFAIVRATFYDDLAQRLTAGAMAGFGEEDVAESRIERFDVAGAYELPFAAKLCADSGDYSGVVCLGAVIRGETDHYDYVCRGAAEGIMRVQLDSGVPCTFGVLTVENMEQALARSGGDKRDQGYNAARTVTQMARLAAGFR